MDFDSAGITIIEDSSDISGHPLQRCHLKSMLQRSEKINNVFCVLFIRNAKEFTEGFAEENLKRMKFCSEIPSTSSKGDAILIDSLSTVCMMDGNSPVLRKILCLNQTFKIPIVALIHMDLHSDEELACFRHISNLYLRLYVENSKLVCESTQKKSTKAFRKKFHFTISSEFSLENLVEISSGDKKKLKDNSFPATAKVEPKSTFNLSLNEKEKRAKAEVKLPHFSVQEAEKKTGAEIHYIPDDFDDFDVEDPDDDLDV